MIDPVFDKRLPLFTLRSEFTGDTITAMLCGESGAGRASILDCMTGLATPDNGHIVLNGVTVLSSGLGIDLSLQARRFGYVFHDYALLPYLNADENVALSLPKEEV